VLRRSALWAVSIVTANSAYAAVIYLYYSLKPPSALPPWKDPETLYLALLFLTVPVGIVLSMVAGCRGAAKWLVVSLLAVSLVLWFVGAIEGISI
jgi:hypothetical protein